MDTPNGREVDFTERTRAVISVTVSESERLIFAKQILIGLATISTGMMVGYACFPDNQALEQMFELVKIGVLPMLTLVISFYFSNGSKK
jgi:F0F1-type ATP synthase membrane subunit c/vacuolar-type H+-ATPase subunit K